MWWALPVGVRAGAQELGPVAPPPVAPERRAWRQAEHTRRRTRPQQEPSRVSRLAEGPAGRDFGGSVSFLTVDAPVAQFFQRDRRTAHRAWYETAGPDHPETIGTIDQRGSVLARRHQHGHRLTNPLASKQFGLCSARRTGFRAR